MGGCTPSTPISNQYESKDSDYTMLSPEHADIVAKAKSEFARSMMVQGMVIIQPDQQIIACNDQFASLTGYERSFLLGRKITILMPDEIAIRHTSFMQRYLTTGIAKIVGKPGREVPMVRADRTAITCLLRVAMITHDHTNYFVGSMMDVSKLAQLRDTARDIKTLRMSSAIMQDMHAPLSSISLTSILVQQELEKHNVDGQLDAIVVMLQKLYTSTLAVKEHMNDLRDIEYHSRRSLYCNKQPCSLMRCIQKACDKIHDAKKIIVENIDEGMYVLADQKRIIQLVFYLLRNSIRAISKIAEGTVRIRSWRDQTGIGDRAETSSVESIGSIPPFLAGDVVHQSLYDSYYNIVIHDNGVGMSDEEVKEIFKDVESEKPITWYMNLEETEQHARTIAGMGVIICKAIVKAHGGRMDVTSARGLGTSIHIRLPLQECAKEEADTNNSPTEIRRPVSTKTEPTLLYVDDDPIQREMISQVLTNLGINHIVATDGPDALRCVSETPSLKLVMMDGIMPGMNGPETAHKIQECRPSLPVVGVSSAELGSEWSGANVHEVENKPITMEMLNRYICKYDL